jgi:hypothetical protein
MKSLLLQKMSKMQIVGEVLDCAKVVVVPLDASELLCAQTGLQAAQGTT